jgi:hypothetical protein
MLNATQDSPLLHRAEQQQSLQHRAEQGLPTTPQQQAGVEIEQKQNVLAPRRNTTQDSADLHRAEQQQFPLHRAEPPQASARNQAVSSAAEILNATQDSTLLHRAEQQQFLQHRAEQGLPTTPQQQTGVEIEMNALEPRRNTPQDSAHLHRAEQQQFPLHRAEPPQASARNQAVSSAAEILTTPQLQSGVEKKALKLREKSAQDSSSQHRAEQQQFPPQCAERPLASATENRVSPVAETADTVETKEVPLDAPAHAVPVLAVGALVRLHGLRAKPEHNGLLGECTAYMAAPQRWAVRILDTAEVFSLKAANLTCLAAKVATHQDLLYFMSLLRDIAGSATNDFVDHFTLMDAITRWGWDPDTFCSCIEQVSYMGFVQPEHGGIRICHAAFLLPPSAA